MGRVCAQCDYNEPREKYSRNQWMKGPGYSRCFDCVGYPCTQCKSMFNSQNELTMHMQVHRPRTVSCPICGVTKFRSGANAVQHVESGYCPCCPGREQAREAIYKFASKKSQMHRYMTDLPRLTYNGELMDNVPDFPYACPHCNGCSFRNASQLLQHLDNKHNHRLLLGN